MDLKPHISILIPTRNNEKDLIDCLNSIRDLDYPFDKMEVIIWDNDSRKECEKKIKVSLVNLTLEKLIKIKLISHDGNYGVYTSRDELFKRVSSNTQLVLSIDDDVILPPNLFKKLLYRFQNDSSIGIIGPRTIFDDDLEETAHGAGFINWWVGRYSDVDAKQAVECDYVIGCCMLIKKSVVDAIGGFDRDYYTSHGEVDFCLKAKNKGFKIIYDPSVCVRHRVDRRGTRTLTRMYYIYRNKIFVIKKNAPFPQKWVSLALYLIFWLPKSILGSVIINNQFNSREIRIILKAMIDGWLNRTGKRL